MSNVAEEILIQGKDLPVWTFKGNLGAGKTTLIKLLALILKVEDNIQSPTFSYVNEYDGKIYHFDCYRLKNIEEALDFGIEEYLDSEKRSWIEWPEVVENLLPKPYLEIKIEHAGIDARNIYTKIIN